MNYISLYNYCNLDKIEYSGTDITSISDDIQQTKLLRSTQGRIPTGNERDSQHPI